MRILSQQNYLNLKDKGDICVTIRKTSGMKQDYEPVKETMSISLSTTNLKHSLLDETPVVKSEASGTCGFNSHLLSPKYKKNMGK